MKRAIVTGAAGFVGLNLVEELLRQDYRVLAIVRPHSAHNARLPQDGRLAVRELEMKDLVRLADWPLSEWAGALFFHLAWGGQRDDFDRQYQNIEGTLAALRQARELSCRRFICTGSQAEYGACTDRLTEEHELVPQNAYGACKVAACQLSRLLAGKSGIEWVWLRLFSVYGKYEPPHTLVSYLRACKEANKSPQLGAARQNWDFLRGEDAARAIVAAAERGKDGAIYNVAQGDYRPLREFIEQWRDKYAPSLSLHFDEKAKNPVSLQPDITRLVRDTGWKPQFDFLAGMDF